MLTVTLHGSAPVPAVVVSMVNVFAPIVAMHNALPWIYNTLDHLAVWSLPLYVVAAVAVFRYARRRREDQPISEAAT